MEAIETADAEMRDQTNHVTYMAAFEDEKS